MAAASEPASSAFWSTKTTGLSGPDPGNRQAGRGAGTLDRLYEPVLAPRDAFGKQRSVVLLHAGDDDVRARYQHRRIADLDHDDRRPFRDGDHLLAAFIAERHPPFLIVARECCDGGVGQGA